MRSLIVGLILFLVQFPTGLVTYASDPAGPDLQRAQRIKNAIHTGDSNTAIAELKALPSEQRQKLGKQHAKVIGLKQNSPTGYALLVADAHMKRLKLGLETCPTQMKSYWKEKEPRQQNLWVIFGSGRLPSW